MINKDELKHNLTIEQIYEYLNELGGNPRIENGIIISQTICHNKPGEGSYKLYYYPNTALFHCYTDCGESFDIFSLTHKVKKIFGKDWNLTQCIIYVASYFGYSSSSFDFEELSNQLDDWKLFKTYKDLNSINVKSQDISLKKYDDKILKYYPKPRIIPWEKEGILKSVMDRSNICYNPVSQSIIIPHYDINNNLIGIRERTLIKENEVYGKYRPAYLNGKLYNHPLSFSLYNINNSKENIKILKKAFVFESEKSTLQYASMMGEESDISVAVCGSNLISYQVKILLSLGVQELIIGFDKQFKEIGDNEYKRWTKKLKDISKKYSPYVNITFLFDTDGLLDYKDSPTDKGIDIFLKLFNNRLDSQGRKINN